MTEGKSHQHPSTGIGGFQPLSERGFQPVSEIWKWNICRNSYTVYCYSQNVNLSELTDIHCNTQKSWFPHSTRINCKQTIWCNSEHKLGWHPVRYQHSIKPYNMGWPACTRDALAEAVIPIPDSLCSIQVLDISLCEFSKHQTAFIVILVQSVWYEQVSGSTTEAKCTKQWARPPFPLCVYGIHLNPTEKSKLLHLGTV